MQAHRVLASSGVLISVSFGQPHFRVPLLLACGGHSWDCRVERFGGSFDYFVYVLRKGRRQAAAGHMQQDAGAEADLLGVALGPRVRGRSADQEAPMHEHMDDESYLTHMTLWMHRRHAQHAATWFCLASGSLPRASDSPWAKQEHASFQITAHKL